MIKKKTTLLSRNAGDENNPHPGGCKIFFNQLNFLNKLYNLRTTLTALFFDSTSFCWKTKSCSKRKKTSFVGINLPVENRLNGEFY